MKATLLKRFLKTAYLTAAAVLLMGSTAYAAETIEEDTVYEEDTEISEDLVIASDTTVTVKSGVTLTIPKDVSVILYGTLEVEDDGVIDNRGTFKVSKTASYDADVITGDGDVVPLSDRSYREIDGRLIFGSKEIEPEPGEQKA